jgi:hypothetical protein
MEKIVTHPLYIRCKKVIDSCETPEQLDTAIRYCKLAKRKTSAILCQDLGNLNDWWSHKVFWDKLTGRF